MSTDDSQPTGAAPAVTQTVPGDPGAPYFGGSSAPAGDPLPDSDNESEPGWFERNATLVISVSVAVIAVAAALVTLFFYRESVDEQNADTEDAVTDFIEEQGQEVESVRCDEGSCSAIVEGAAYSVLVHEDEDGDRTFGVSAYAGN
ncbi:hypothetical protein SAMN05660662_0977 [Blastococcus aurantiacus]|uniref:DUF4333 domain-containing protein n=1 Tax=Blastococcus aurantiacus TaxID=1550231 RepID=A0A1G7I3T6_9ACTN|nr:hypothetical protein [Blastococcus aurantiacus]SDF07126.1 hypothetical protein SAMN05660662_0977 [Blastococcus aurantiacus]